MKVLFTLLLLILAIHPIAQGQVVIDNFESNRIAQYGYRDGTLSTVANPSQSGINASSQVGRYIRNGAAQYDVMRIQVPGYYNDVTAYTTSARTLRMKVYSPSAGIPVQLSFEDTNRTTPFNYPIGRYCVVFATTTRANQWEELVFTSPNIPDAGTSPLGINVILLSFNINSFTSGTYYFDDVQVPDYTTFNLVWSEEFSGNSLNRNNWNVEVNDFGGGNNELQYYTDRTDNIQVTGGQLNLIARRENYGNRQYTSGRINSSGLAGVLYGRISVRARIPSGQGIWPAAWMLPTDWAYGGWPNSGEIDIMEALGHEPNKVYGTIHYANPNYTYNSQSYTKPSGNFSDGFHVYEVAWTPTRINFLVDSVQIHSIPFQGRPFDRRFHMVLNLAVGGNWPGSPDGTTVFPATYSIDYVRMYGSQLLCNAPTTPTISGNATFCSGSSTTLTSSATTGNLWNTGATTQSITVTEGGNYSVRVIAGSCTSVVSNTTAVSTIACNQIFTGNGLFTNINSWSSNSIPVTGTDITVRGNLNLTSSVSLRNINIENGGIVIPSGIILTVTGNLTNQGNISGDGTIRLAGANNQEFGGGTINNLLVNNSATVVLNAATQISGSLSLGSSQILNLNNQILRMLSTATQTAQLTAVSSSSSISNAGNFTIQRWLNSSLARRGATAFGNYYFVGPVVQGQTMNLWNAESPYNNQTFSGTGVGNLYLYNPTANNWYKPSSASAVLPVGAGIQVWFGTTSFFGSRNTWSAVGAPQVGDYNMPITSNQGFQLLSNPYPSTIDWDSPNWTKTNVSNAIYVYDWVNRRYKSYIDGIGTNGGNRYLPTAQGFIVRAENNTPVLTARENIKVSNQVTLQRTESLVNSIIRLQVSRGNMSDEVVIAHRPNAQLAFEPQADAQKMINPATNVFIGGIISQSIASMDLNAVNEIPIMLLSDSSGMVTLNTTEFTNISEGPYYLVDEITTEVYPYTPETRYNFFLNANEPYSLTLRMNNVTAIKNFTNNQFEVFPNPATDQITIKTKGIGDIEILNIMGKLLITQPATETNEINIAKLVKGVYTVKFNGISQKLIVK